MHNNELTRKPVNLNLPLELYQSINQGPALEARTSLHIVGPNVFDRR
jgi:hypothetical protein